jgi:hypothetical protein
MFHCRRSNRAPVKLYGFNIGDAALAKSRASMAKARRRFDYSRNDGADMRPSPAPLELPSPLARQQKSVIEAFVVSPPQA